jgi:predicted MFS family arabinose efflux permease
MGVIGSLSLLALTMGFSQLTAAKLTIMFSVGYVTASFLYYLLPKRFSVPMVGLMGSILLAALIFMPGSSATLFLFLAFLAQIGKVLVDFVIPEMVFRMIDPQIAGAYNSWRAILSNVTSTVTVYLIGILAERISPLFLLVPAAAAYLISMLWYFLLYKRFRRF